MKRFTKLIPTVLIATMAFSACSKREDKDDNQEETTEIEVTEETEATEETEETELTATATPTSLPTSTPMPTATPTPEILTYTGSGVAEPLPEMSFADMTLNDGASYEEELLRYLNEVLVPDLGIKTQDEFYVNESHSYAFEGEQYSAGSVGSVNMLDNADAIIGKYINDFDNDGTPEMVVLGIARGNIDSNLVSNYYRPYMLLCSIDGNHVTVSDILEIREESGRDYSLDNGEPFAYSNDPAIFTSSGTSAFYFLTRLVDTGSEIQIQGYVTKLESFVGDGIFKTAWEMHIVDGKFEYMSYATQGGWGSSDYSTIVYHMVNGVIDETQTETLSYENEDEYFDRLNWGIYSANGINWATINVGMAYTYGERSTNDAGIYCVDMVYDIVDR